jgi:hypothetical protein
MSDIEFKAVDSAEADKMIAEIAAETEAAHLPPGKIAAMVASLPFYDDFQLYSLSDNAGSKPNTRYALYKKGDGKSKKAEFSLLNWTNEPIYSVNEKAPIKVDKKTVIPYAKFFFHFVRGQLGRFIIVEKPDDVIWLSNATTKEKADVAERLTPVTYKGVGRDSLFTLSATVIFKNALFKTDIKIAPFDMDAFDAEANAPEHFTIGQMKLTNEDLLLEDLNVPIDAPPGEFDAA